MVPIGPFIRANERFCSHHFPHQFMRSNKKCVYAIENYAFEQDPMTRKHRQYIIRQFEAWSLQENLDDDLDMDFDDDGNYDD